MSSTGTTKVDRVNLTDEQYITALEVSNETMAKEIYRLRQMLIASVVYPVSRIEEPIL